jgi:fumarate reductase flavoprotein subunit
MCAYQGYAAVAYPQGQLLSWTTIEKGGVLVSETGQRFGNEDLGYSGFASHVMAQGAFAWAIYDARIHGVALAEEEYAEMSAMGAVKWADTPGSLAEVVGLNPAGLEEAIEDYNAATKGDRKDSFGRTAFAMAPLQAPFAAVKVKPGLFHTQGGLLVDNRARVRKVSGGVVDNLFAGGGAAAGISGCDGALGYASGNGLITALVLGRKAGMVAIEEIRAEA